MGLPTSYRSGKAERKAHIHFGSVLHHAPHLSPRIPGGLLHLKQHAFKRFFYIGQIVHPLPSFEKSLAKNCIQAHAVNRGQLGLFYNIISYISSLFAQQRAAK
jgi:hypothetical protein